MLAAVLKEIGNLVVEEVPTPSPAGGTFLVRIGHAALCGSDLRAVTNGSRLIRKYPRIIGHDMAGTVETVGPGVDGVTPGERLVIVPGNPCTQCEACRRGYSPDLCPNFEPIGFFHDGGFAVYLLVPPSAVRGQSFVPVPDGVSLRHAALAEPLGCVVHAQEMTDVHQGDAVAVFGAGPMGLMNCLVARLRGARMVILLQRSQKRLELARERGLADVYINTSELDPVAAVREATGGGADVVITAVSSGESHELALELAALRGRINLFGGLPRDNSVIRFDSNKVHYRELTVLGSAGTDRDCIRKALDLMACGRIDMESLITHEVPLSEIHRGMDLIRKGKALKVIVTP